MHQSWMLCIHWLNVFTQFSGMNWTWPEATASIAFCAMLLPSGAGVLTATNH